LFVCVSVHTSIKIRIRKKERFFARVSTRYSLNNKMLISVPVLFTQLFSRKEKDSNKNNKRNTFIFISYLTTTFRWLRLLLIAINYHQICQNEITGRKDKLVNENCSCYYSRILIFEYIFCPSMTSFAWNLWSNPNIWIGWIATRVSE